MGSEGGGARPVEGSGAVDANEDAELVGAEGVEHTIELGACMDWMCTLPPVRQRSGMLGARGSAAM